MQIRRYVGADEKELLRKIRADLGADAVILHSSYAKRSGLLAFFARPRIEIVAGGGFKIVKDYPNGEALPAAAPKASGASAETLQKEIGEIKRLIAETQTMVSCRSGVEGPQELSEEYASLATTRVSEGLAQKMMGRLRSSLSAEALRDRARIRSAVRTFVKDMIRCTDGIALKPGRCTRVAFIGPTGVGKTTTIAKLVSIYAHRGREVAVITNDTYRIAAAEQIKRVAQLVGVPIRVCQRPQEIEQALKEFSNRDLVLVDTAGRSQKNTRRLDDLKEVLAATKPDETHLVVSMTTQPETVVDVAERFASCGYDRLVVTKLDEAIKLGVVLDVLSRIQTELSFVTTGQEIPRDIEVADSSRLASLILGDETL
ncbi:MAG TPA: GTP-binding protein [Planctomycetota bacterium]|jgi:flagellar biosynthesis protein FlhF|nr:GTP-binding protein [Planctomycetota bacterium]